MSALFGPEFRTLEAALAAREQLQAAHASNIANADTPHAHADTRTFDDFLAEETKKQFSSTAMGADLGDSRSWMSFDGGDQGGGLARIDGNNVNMQKEMVGMAENQLMHDLTLRLLKGKLNGLANVIKSGGR